MSLRLSRCWLQYWDDPADDIQEREGTLLPLWRFTAAPAQGRHVTALAWNPAYPGGTRCAHQSRRTAIPDQPPPPSVQL